MNLALLSALIGDKQALFLNNLYVAVANALPLEQQLFVSENIRGMHDYLQSDAGKLALQELVSDWQHAVKLQTAAAAKEEPNQ